MHLNNYIPICKSIRIHTVVTFFFSDWAEFKYVSFKVALLTANDMCLK